MSKERGEVDRYPEIPKDLVDCAFWDAAELDDEAPWCHCGHFPGLSDLEEAYPPAAVDVEEKSSWTHVATLDETSAFVRPKNSACPADGFWYRWRFPLRMNYEDTISYLRPEAMLEEDRGPVTLRYVSDAALVAVGEPGEVVWRYQVKPWFVKVMTLLGGHHDLVDDDIDEKDLPPVHRCGRHVLRRDFPREGTTTMVGVCGKPLHVGMRWWTTIRATRSNEWTEVFETLETASVPLTAFRAFMEYRCKAYPIPSPPSADQARENCDFLVLGLRKCCRGVPYVPKLPKGEEPASNTNDPGWLSNLKWSVAEDVDCFQLLEYMRCLVDLFESPIPLPIWDSLDGRRLVWHQVAVPRRIWPLLEEKIEPIMRKHRSVYKHRKGGNGAPFIQAFVAPKYISSYARRPPQPPLPLTPLTMEDVSTSSEGLPCEWLAAPE